MWYQKKANNSTIKCLQKKFVKFCLKLDAEISIWMSSRYDGYDFSATLDPYPVYPQATGGGPKGPTVKFEHLK